jgi:hypothetical protein
VTIKAYRTANPNLWEATATWKDGNCLRMVNGEGRTEEEARANLAARLSQNDASQSVTSGSASGDLPALSGLEPESSTRESRRDARFTTAGSLVIIVALLALASAAGGCAQGQDDYPTFSDKPGAKP